MLESRVLDDFPAIIENSELSPQEKRRKNLLCDHSSIGDRSRKTRNDRKSNNFDRRACCEDDIGAISSV